MRIIDRVYIDGSFVEPHGEQWAPLFNPATEEQIGKVRLADEEDANRAVAAARRAFPAFSNTSKEERITMLKRLHAAVSERAGDLVEAMRVEYAAAEFHRLCSAASRKRVPRYGGNIGELRFPATHRPCRRGDASFGGGGGDHTME
ncbi:unnamed protein product (plasmid) [Sinorhizobium meliloti Rm41]|nr:unnamed protein product [Sinorhizobium meliloti Rm41]